MTPEPDKVLLISNDERLKSIISFSLESTFALEVIEVRTNDILSQFANLANKFSTVIYDFSEEDYLIDDLAKILASLTTRIPLVVIGSKELTNYQKKGLLTFSVDKSQIIKGLSECIKKCFKVDTRFDPEEYCRVSIKTLDIFDGISNDLYIQLSSGRYLKLFQKGDELSKSDVDRYVEKGVNNLYLKQKTCRWVLDQVNSQVPLYLKNKNFKFILRSPDSAPEKIFEQKLIRTNDQLNVTEDFQKEIKDKVERVIEGIKSHPRFKNPLKLLRLNDPPLDYMNAHINLLIIASASLAREMGWHSNITLEKLVYASILHDITLASRPDLAKIKTADDLDELNLSKEDKKLYLEHPSEISSLVKSSFQFAPADTDVIIFQHHELPDGTGFPKKITSGRIIPLSTLFIIAHDLADYIIDNEKLDIEDYILKAEKKFSSINFNKIISCLKKMKEKK